MLLVLAALVVSSTHCLHIFCFHFRAFPRWAKAEIRQKYPKQTAELVVQCCSMNIYHHSK